MGWTEDDLDVGGVRIHYSRRGRGRPLVLAHGAADSGECWSRIAEALEDEYDVVAYDARYHGLSDAPEDTSGGGPHDLIAVVEALGLERPAAMGHSMGAGSVAAALALRPDLFRCAVLEDGGLGTPRRLDPSSETGKRMAAVREWMASLRTKTFDEIVEIGRRISPSWHPDEFAPWARAKQRYRPPSGGPPVRTGFDSWRDMVAKWACPVLLVRADPARGSVVSPDGAEEAKRLCPALDVVALDAGHNVRREAYDEFVALARRFLADERL